MEKIKSTIILSCDLTAGFTYFLVLFGIVAWALNGDKEWLTITLGDFFNGSKLFLVAAIISLFYLPPRLILGNDFWGIIFKNNN